MPKLETAIEHREGAERTYLLKDNHGECKDYVPDSAEWFQWLSGLKAFRFVGKLGSFTARQEAIVGKDKKQRGGQYWFAYRKFRGRQFKRYLGLSERLSLDYLEDAARRIEIAMKEKFGTSEVPNPSSSQQITPDENALQRRIAEQEQVIANQRVRIQQLEDSVATLEAQLQQITTKKEKRVPKIEETAPEGFTYLADFCTLHHIPYSAAEQLFPHMIRGQRITQRIALRSRNHPVIGPKGRHDFWVQLHTRPDYVTCDDCPHLEEGSR